MKTIMTALVLHAAILFVASPTPANDDLLNGVTVHEWGTFTSIAGYDGLALEWTPAGGPADLPCFVDSLMIKYRLVGRVRMETPVLYFYSPREATLDVRVDFPEGTITEWYPDRTPLAGGNPDPRSIAWKRVEIRPGAPEDFPIEERPSHYYAARATDAAPLRVGGETEKLLFYRGVGDFQPSIAATVDENGGVYVRNIGRADEIRGVVLFENRDGEIGYRIHGAMAREAVLEPPRLDADVDSLYRELVRILVHEGLYPEEAEAMVETWRDSWFEEGARLFYVVPPARVDALLPLSIKPAPASLARVFVGRMEILTPSILDAVETAIRTHDTDVLARHGRFLEPTVAELTRSGRLSPEEQIRGQDAVGRLRGLYRAVDPCRMRALPVGSARSKGLDDPTVRPEFPD